MNNQYSVLFGEDKLVYTKNDIVTEYEYKNIYNVKYLRGLYVFHVSQEKIVILPKEFIENTDEFENLVSEKICEIYKEGSGQLNG